MAKLQERTDRLPGSDDLRKQKSRFSTLEKLEILFGLSGRLRVERLLKRLHLRHLVAAERQPGHAAQDTVGRVALAGVVEPDGRGYPQRRILAPAALERGLKVERRFDDASLCLRRLGEADEDLAVGITETNGLHEERLRPGGVAALEELHTGQEGDQALVAGRRAAASSRGRGQAPPPPRTARAVRERPGSKASPRCRLDNAPERSVPARRHPRAD